MLTFSRRVFYYITGKVFFYPFFSNHFSLWINNALCETVRKIWDHWILPSRIIKDTHTSRFCHDNLLQISSYQSVKKEKVQMSSRPLESGLICSLPECVKSEHPTTRFLSNYVESPHVHTLQGRWSLKTV